MYDYIIVGAGSAGCVLAARLTEDPHTQVLLLEAGGPDTAGDIRMPAGSPRLYKTAHDWGYTTARQKELHERELYWPRGRILGGSSSINAMIYIRGNPLDYDAWRDEYGCTGWSYSELLPYFLRAEDQARGATSYHGTGGPLRVEDLRHKHRLTKAFVESARACGLAANEDFNAAAQDGVGFYQVTQRRGERCSTAAGYLRPAMSRPNLTVHTDALTTQVLFDKGRAIGVRYLHDGVEQRVLAHSEIIVAGGAVSSPQLLMLSGVGPAPHLGEHDIEVVAEQPEVGRNLQDHVMAPNIWHTPRVRNAWEDETLRHLLYYMATRRGPVASNIAESGGFVRTTDGLPAPDIQFHTLPVPMIEHGLVEPIGRAVSVMVTLVDVASRGWLRLRSADPRWKPIIDPAYLTEPADLDKLVAGVRMSREIVARQPLSRLVSGEYTPGGDVTDTDGLREFVRNWVETLYHPVGTCAMGGGNAVCDPELRVRGVEGLRVVDAAVMPKVPRGNTNAPTIAVAEKAADLIAGRPPLAPVTAEAAQPTAV